MVESSWLTLGQASRLLGIHPTTLRAWVDAGLVHAFLTPGRHRRFKESELRAFLDLRRSGTPGRSPDTPPALALETVRRQLTTEDIGRQNWYRQMSDADRTRHRATGARLFGLLLQYVAQHDKPRQFLLEARDVAADYGREFARAERSLVELAQAFLFFRRLIVTAIHSSEQNGATYDRQDARLFLSVDEFMDELLLATLDAYVNSFDHSSIRPAPMHSRRARIKGIQREAELGNG